MDSVAVTGCQPGVQPPRGLHSFLFNYHKCSNAFQFCFVFLNSCIIEIVHVLYIKLERIHSKAGDIYRGKNW